MAAFTTKLGLEGHLAVQTDGVSGSAGWNEETRIKDLTLSGTGVTTDVTGRHTGGFKATRVALTDLEFTFDLVWDTADTVAAAIMAAFTAKTALGLRVLDEDGGTGFEGDVVVTEFGFSQPIEGGQTVPVRMVPTYSDTAPTFA